MSVLVEKLVPLPVPDSFEEAVAVAREVAENESTTKWLLGWYAGLIPKEYGKATLEVWAGRVGLSKSAAMKYRWVASRFTPEHVVQFPELTFSHFAVLARLAETDIELALDWAERASTNNGAKDRVWTVDELAQNIAGSTRPDKPKPFAVPGGRFVIEKRNGKTYISIVVPDKGDQWEEAADNAGILGAWMKASFTRVEED